MELKNYLDGTVQECITKINNDHESGELSTDDLVELESIETAGGDRKGVLDHLNDLLNEALGTPGSTPPQKPQPDWQAADYTGPLSCDQANWRKKQGFLAAQKK